MQLSTGLKPEELDNLRRGFDFIVDIDAKIKLEHAAIAAKVVCDFLKDRGIKPSVKFSGSRGFHIGVAGNAFPEKIDFKETKNRYPEILQAMAGYVSQNVKETILEELIKFEGGVAALISCAKSVSELSPYEFIDIERNWGSRHLFRMPYSLHPKFWLVSLPMDPHELKKFDKEMARPENVTSATDFLINKEGEGADFLIKALEWKLKQPKEDATKSIGIRRKSDVVVPEEQFPPCIKLILNGLLDGKKRSLFTLISFLRTMNWKPGDIEKRIEEWNAKNAPPLSERSIKTQLKWHFRQARDLLPANCSSDMFYRSMGVCSPDMYCSKNPVNYPFRKNRDSKNDIRNSDEKKT
jgi:hypothetical protein